MTTFILTSPDGKEFEVEGPEGSTAEQAWEVFQNAQRASSPAYDEALTNASAASQSLAGPVPQIDEWERAMLLPMETNTRTQERRPAMPGLITGAANSAIDMFNLPGDTLAGKYDEQLDPRLGVAPSPDLIGRGMNFGANTIGWGEQVLGTSGKLFEKTATALPRVVDDVVTRATGVGTPEGRDMAVARYLAAGPDGMVVDASPSAANALDTAIQQSGPGADMARDAVAVRAGRADANVVGELDRILGEPEAVSSLVRKTAADTAEARDMAYRAAYDQPIPNTAQGSALPFLLDRAPPSAKAAAEQLMRMEGVDPGSVQNTVLYADYVTRGLNAAAKGTEGSGALGQMTDVGRGMKRLANEIRTNAKELVPGYAIALDTAATPIARKEALEFGASMLSPNTTRDDVAIFLEGASKPEILGAKEGLRSQVDELRGNVKRLISRPNQDAAQAKAQLDALSSPNTQAKMKMLLGDEDFAALDRIMEESRTALELYSNTDRGSATARRTFINDDISTQVEGGAYQKLKQGEVPSALKRIIQGITGEGPAAQMARKDEIYTAIAQALVKQGPEGKALLETLGKRVGGVPFTNLSDDKIMAVARALLAGQQSAPNTRERNSILEF